MEDDIVARLRRIAFEFPRMNQIMDGEWESAADEIERLRERVRIYEGVMRNAKRDIDSLRKQIEETEARRG